MTATAVMMTITKNHDNGHHNHDNHDNHDNNSRQCLWCCHNDELIVTVHPTHLINAEQCYAAAKCQQSDQVNCLYAAIVYTHHSHLLLLLRPKADTHY